MESPRSGASSPRPGNEEMLSPRSAAKKSVKRKGSWFFSRKRGKDSKEKEDSEIQVSILHGDKVLGAVSVSPTSPISALREAIQENSLIKGDYDFLNADGSLRESSDPTTPLHDLLGKSASGGRLVRLLPVDLDQNQFNPNANGESSGGEGDNSVGGLSPVGSGVRRGKIRNSKRATQMKPDKVYRCTREELNGYVISYVHDAAVAAVAGRSLNTKELKRVHKEALELLPPKVTEEDLMAACSYRNTEPPLPPAVRTTVLGACAETEAVVELEKETSEKLVCDVQRIKLYTLPVAKRMEEVMKEVATGSSDGMALEESVPRILAVAHAEQGMRPYMEDRHVIIEDLTALCGVCACGEDNSDSCKCEPTSFFAVYDGHAGMLAAEYTRLIFHHNVANHPDYHTDLSKAITDAYEFTNKNFIAMAACDAIIDGATAVTIAVRGDTVYSHWAGDSECTLSHRGRHLALVDPHKPERPDEKARVEADGGTVVFFGGWRVNGTLGVARSIGDLPNARHVISTPDTKTHTLTKDDHAFIIASDGMYDVIPGAEVASITAHWLNDPQRAPHELPRALVGESLRRMSRDNITVVCVFLPRHGKPPLRGAKPSYPRVPTALPPKPDVSVVKAAESSS